MQCNLLSAIIFNHHYYSLKAIIIFYIKNVVFNNKSIILLDVTSPVEHNDEG